MVKTMNKNHILVYAIFVSISSIVLHAEELGPYFPNTPRAPLDVQKGQSPTGSLTRDEVKEVVSEFGGILYMGLQNYSYDKWQGKEMSDCRPATSEAWCYQCAMITGHATTYYSFYRDANRRSCTLQQMDVHFEVADPNVIKYLKRPVHSLLGEAVSDFKSSSSDAEWGGSGNAWKWKSEEDLAYLYMDSDAGTANGQGLARFQWRRSPLLNLYSPLAKSNSRR